MSRRRIALATVTVLILCSVAWLGKRGLVYVPDFYQQALSETRDPQLRREQAIGFEQHSIQLVSHIRNSDEWSEEFSQQEINSWFAEALATDFPHLLPAQVTEPRVVLPDDLIQLGFRYRSRSWDGILSLQMRPYVSDYNQIALEIQELKAGFFPLPIDRVIPIIRFRQRPDGLMFSWSQANGHDVLLITFSDTLLRGQTIDGLEVENSRFRIGGRRAGAAGTPTQRLAGILRNERKTAVR